ncbi:MAG: AraC family transcriptional regulator [Pirellulales bacterium]|nr:AraC family transcriptional regulator [Pirellulales bacterium]
MNDHCVVLPAGTVWGASSRQDRLSEVLDLFPLDIRFAGRFALSAPWGIGVPEGMAMVCIVTEGSCLATADNVEERTLGCPGDVLLLSPGAEHRLCDAPKTPVAPPVQWLQSVQADNPLLLVRGGGAASTVLLGGVFQFEDPQMHPFYWGLPPVIHLTSEAVGRFLHLRRLRRSIDDELSVHLPGGQSIVRRLIEILFIEAARLCLDTDENLGGQLLHSDLGPALALMHRQPERPWTVAELAERVAMSRSAFAATFAKVLGRPPVQYLRERRMQLARQLLRNPSLGLKEIAMRVGYDSVSAFNSAFKQRWGVAPGQFRNVPPG